MVNFIYNKIRKRIYFLEINFDFEIVTVGVVAGAKTRSTFLRRTLGKSSPIIIQILSSKFRKKYAVL